MVQLTMGDEMPRDMTDREAQNKYNERMFGIKTKTFEKVKLALKYAHEIRQFEIRLYWHRSFFFWGFIIAFLTAFTLVFDYKSDDQIKTIAAILLSSMGLFTTFAWRYIEIGSKTWQANWEKHIDFLENEITGQLHKVNIGKPLKFFSVSSIHETFICSMIFFWLVIFLLSIYPIVILLINYMEVDDNIKECLMTLKTHLDMYKYPYFKSSIIVLLLIFWLIFRYFSRKWLGPKGTWQKGTWRTNFGTEPPAEPIDGNKLTLRYRESPDVHFVTDPYIQSK